MRVAVIDLGTNTFNLLISDSVEDENFQIIYNTKIPVKLGEKRIDDGEIIPAAYKRGIEAVLAHYEIIKEHKVDLVKAFGTSALRTAKNGPDFLSEIKAKTNIDVEIISGDREAELIYKGVSQTFNFTENPIVILDIGGGSNEFIIATNKDVLWKKSYPLGIARLIQRFQPENPLSKKQVENINNYLVTELEDLFVQLEKYKVNTLIGASGSFETFTAMIAEIDWVSESTKEAISVPIALPDFDFLYNRLIFSTIQERKQMKGLEPMRVEMIVLAALFVKSVIAKSGIIHMYQSSFALKEGAVAELLYG